MVSLINGRSFRALVSAIAILTLTSCTTAVNYGKIPHARLAQGEICNPDQSITDSADVSGGVADKKLFFVTTRLPDCRAGAVIFTSFRSEVLRFGRFAYPQKQSKIKGQKQQKSVPTLLMSDSQWWDDIESAAERNNGRILVYVHGFKESFLSTSRDSYQIARLTGFGGPVVQYSWPSQNDLFDYSIDETNVSWDQGNFRRFLVQLASRGKIKDIVLVSHSLGVRLVLDGIEFADTNTKVADSNNISNIILASPDIDRQDFERNIAKQILSAKRVANGRHMSIYVSSKDKALALSRAVHGYPRLGSPYCFDPDAANALTAQGLQPRCYAGTTDPLFGLTIIDTSDVGGKKSGHSDYLTRAEACADFKSVVSGGRSVAVVRLKTQHAHVFTLALGAELSKDGHKSACQRED